MSSRHEKLRKPDTELSATPEGKERLLGQYIDRLLSGEILDLDGILQAHPDDGLDIVEQLRTYQEMLSNGDGSVGFATLGDYTLIEPVGRGGMGVVYEAWQNSLNRRVALKMLPVGLAADTKSLTRFMREAQVAGRLNHPSIVPVYAMGVEHQTPFYAMEYVDGYTLATKLSADSAKSSATVAPRSDSRATASTRDGDRARLTDFLRISEAFIGVADGLQHAHENGVIHRDIKPSNLMFDSRTSDHVLPEGTLRILDFGLAHFEGQESLTLAGDVVGTIYYMSPEQARAKKSRPIDHRTDIYSFGATLYEALTYQPPFKGSDSHDTLSQIILQEPVAPRRINSRIPKDLETIVLKCLRKDPADRYGTAEAAAADLRRFVRGDPIEARPQTSVQKAIHRTWKYRWRLIVSSLLLIFALGTLWFAWQQNQAKRTLDLARRQTEYPILIRSALSKLRLTQFVGHPSSGFELGLSPWGFSLLDEHSNLWIMDDTSQGQDSVRAAIAQLNEAIELLPEKADAYWHRARAHLQDGKVPAAREDLRRVMDHQPGHVPALVLLADILSAEGKTDEADEHRRQAEFHARGNRGESWLAGQRFSRDGDWDRAAESFLRCRKHSDHSSRGRMTSYIGFAVELRVCTAIALWNARRYIEALQEIGRVTDEYADLPEAQLIEAAAWLGEEHYDKATVLLDDAFHRSEHQDAFALAAFLVAYRHAILRQETDSQGYDLIKAACIEWAERIPDPSLSETAKAMSLLLFGDSQAALGIAQQAVQSAPGDPRCYSALTVIQLRTSRSDAAAATARKALELLADDDGSLPSRLGRLFHSRLALALARQGKAKEALAECRIIEASPMTWATRLNLAMAYWNLGRPKKALEIVEAFAGEGRRYTVFALWAELLEDLGQFDDALAKVEIAVSLAPNYADVHRVRGNILNRLNRRNEAIQAYQRAVSLHSEDAMERLGTMHEEDGDLASAYDCYVRALRGNNALTYMVDRLARVIRAATHPELGESPANLVALVQARLDQVEPTPGSQRSDHIDNVPMSIRDRIRYTRAIAECYTYLGRTADAHRTWRDLALLYERPDVHPNLLQQRPYADEMLAPDLASFASVDRKIRGSHLILREGHTWRFFRGHREPSVGLQWTRPGFDDSDWENGPSPFSSTRHARVSTLLASANRGYTTFYVRAAVGREVLDGYQRFVLRIKADDGAVAYLNGDEIGRHFAGRRGDRLPYDATTTGSGFSDLAFRFRADQLIDGENVIAIQLVNDAARERQTKIHLSPTLSGIEPRDEKMYELLTPFFEFAQRHPDDESLATRTAYARACLLHRQGQNEEAIERFREVIRHDPSRPEPFVWLAKCQRKKSPKEAQQTLRDLMRRFPDHRPAWELWANISLADTDAAWDEPLRQLGELKAEFEGAQAVPPALESMIWLFSSLRDGKLLRINCGSREDRIIDGKPWSRDRFFDPSNMGSVSVEVADVPMRAVFTRARLFWNDGVDKGYRVPLPNGRYRVFLHFIEDWWRVADSRRFSINIEGETLENFEPLQAGFGVTHQRSFDVDVNDGLLNILLLSQSDKPLICGLRIETLSE